MIREIALDMFRGNFPFPPNFHLLLICVGESAALSTTSVWVTAVSRCLLQKARKQRLLRQPSRGYKFEVHAGGPQVSHQHRHHEFKGRKINDLQNWRRGWDSSHRH